MKRGESLNSLPNADIVHRFEQLCIEQYDAMERDENARVNRLIWRVHALEMELKSRAGDQRRLLISLFGHPNMQVRLSAARANLAVDYLAARRELQDIVDGQWQPQAMDAGITLHNIDTGFYRPQ